MGRQPSVMAEARPLRVILPSLERRLLHRGATVVHDGGMAMTTPGMETTPVPRKQAAARRGEAGFSIVELMIVLVFISIIAGIAISAGMYAFDAARLGRTVANMRGVADAIVKYQSDNSMLPAGGMQVVSAIAPLPGPNTHS